MVSKKLHSDFSFGFEFEGFAKIQNFLGDIENYSYFRSFSSWDSIPCNNLYEDDFRQLYNNVNEFINDKLHSRRGRTHYDGSVKNYLNGYQSFEYSSPVFKFTPKNIKLIKDFFVNMNEYGFGINNTCGFHTHISFPDITENDAIWIVSQIAIDDKKIEEFCYLHNKDEIIDFYNDRYASKSFLLKIRDDIMNNNYYSLMNHINSEKYRVIRIHPQGTLEWRGPRNFLNRENGINIYISKLAKIMDILGESLNATHINGISKNEYFNNIHDNKTEYYLNGYKFSSKSKYIIRNGISCLTDKFGDKTVDYNTSKIANCMAKSIIRHPENIFSIDVEPFFSHVVEKLKRNNSVSSILNYLIDNKDSLKISIDNQIKLIKYFPSYISILSNEAFKKLESFDIFNIIENMCFRNVYNGDIDKNIKFLLRNIDKKLLISCSLTFLNNANWTISSILDLMEEGLYKDENEIYKLYSRYCRSYILNGSEDKSIFPITPKDLHDKMLNFINNGLLEDITDNIEFGKKYSVSSFAPSFFTIDALNSFNTFNTESLVINMENNIFALENSNSISLDIRVHEDEVECEDFSEDRSSEDAVRPTRVYYDTIGVGDNS